MKNSISCTVTCEKKNSVFISIKTVGIPVYISSAVTREQE
jgi:hypothetical protein